MLSGTFQGYTGINYTVPDLNPVHPLTFKPEFVDAFEVGTKNTLLDGALTLNLDGFYYNYENYQISEIVDRTSINLNFDAHVKGAEAEATWEPVPGLRFNFAGGWEDATLAKGTQAIDLIDRTAGNSNWVVVKPFVTQASNCILPTYVIAANLAAAKQQVAVTRDRGLLRSRLSGSRRSSSLCNLAPPALQHSCQATLDLIQPQLPTMGQDLTRISVATNCRMRRH